MEQVYPAVLEWNLNVQSVEFDDATGSFAATTRVTACRKALGQGFNVSRAPSHATHERQPE